MTRAHSPARTRAPLTLALAVVVSWAPPQPLDEEPLAPVVLEQLEQRVVAAAERALAATVGLRIREGWSVGDGSGVIVSPEGYVVTVAHNFSEPGTRMRVYLQDGREVTGTGLGRNERGDYALVKLEGEGPWPHVEMGSAEVLDRYELCVMTGHAGGIVEGRGPVVRVGTYLGRRNGYWLRSECAMMPGDSGGALFDLDGKVVGINSYIEERIDANYHAPIDQVREAWERLVDGEEWNLTRETRRARSTANAPALGLSVRSGEDGLSVTRVLDGYPAGPAGVEVGDLITAVDGDPITSALALRRLEREARDGDLFRLSIVRDGDALEIEVAVAAREED